MSKFNITYVKFMFNKNVLLCFSYFLFQIYNTNAQDTTFNAYLNKTDLIYSAPKSYSKLNYSGYFVADPNYILSTIFYSIKSNENDIVIGISLVPIVIDDKESLTSELFPNEPNNNWKLSIKTEADTSSNNIEFYNKKQLAYINADNAALYQLKMKRIFLGKYNFCKVIIMHKQNWGDAELLYFYNDKSKDVIDKQIKATKDILKFKTDKVLLNN